MTERSVILFESTVQIAGVTSPDEARMLEELGTDLIGFPLRLGYHAPDTSEAVAREIIGSLKIPSRAVLITYLTDALEIRQFASCLGVSKVQLHAEITPAEICRLKFIAPSLSIIKSLIVRPECSDSAHPLYDLAQEFDPYVDAFITDTFDPKTGATGATGLRHDWSVSARIAKLIKKPLILAGGLKPDNVYDAIMEVRPASVDAHTGVEDVNGAKSPSLVTSFISEARRAFSNLAGR